MGLFMKISLLGLLLAASITTAFGQAAACDVNGKHSDEEYYTDCFPFDSMLGDTNDDDRVQRAVNAASATGGKLIFNESPYVFDTEVTLHSFTTIEGMAATDGNLSYTVINSIGTKHAVFLIGENEHHIAVRDMGMRNGTGKPANSLRGIWFLGTGSATPISSTTFEFSNLRFEGLTKGIEVYSTGSSTGWQVDSAHVENSSFLSCEIGIHLNSDNTGWQMDNLSFSSGEDQDAIYIERAGYVNMNMIVGNGSRDGKGVPIAGKFITIERHGNINIQSAFGEAYKKSMQILGFQTYKMWPITLVNNMLPGCAEDGEVDDADPAVLIRNAVVVSQGNHYGCTGVGRPVIQGWADVSSSGDRFCFDQDPGSNCFSNMLGKSEFVVQGEEVMLNVDHTGDPGEWLKPVTEILSSYNNKTGDTDPVRPLLALTSSAFISSNVEKYTYNFSRNRANGRLEIEGDQGANKVGYHFKNGPVQLQSTAYSGIGAFTASSDDGSMIFCSDCVAGSTPCAASGGGALALRVGGAWHCK